MTATNSPHEELEILRPYVIEEFGGVYVYCPAVLYMTLANVTPEDRKVRACLDELFKKKVVRGGPWPWLLGYVGDQNKKRMPALFDGRIQTFEIYRIDTAYWQKLLVQ